MRLLEQRSIKFIVGLDRLSCHGNPNSGVPLRRFLAFVPHTCFCKHMNLVTDFLFDLINQLVFISFRRHLLPTLFFNVVFNSLKFLIIFVSA